MFNEENKFSLRKLTIGLASVMIGVSFMSIETNTVKADTVQQNNVEEMKQSTSAVNQDNNTQQGINSAKETNSAVTDVKNNNAAVKEQATDVSQSNNSDTNETLSVNTKTPADNNTNELQVNKVSTVVSDSLRENKVAISGPKADNAQYSANTKQTPVGFTRGNYDKYASESHGELYNVKSTNVTDASTNKAINENEELPENTNYNVRDGSSYTLGYKGNFTVKADDLTKGSNILLSTINTTSKGQGDENSFEIFPMDQSQHDLTVNNTHIGKISFKRNDKANTDLVLNIDTDLGKVSKDISFDYNNSWAFQQLANGDDASFYNGLSDEKKRNMQIVVNAGSKSDKAYNITADYVPTQTVSPDKMSLNGKFDSSQQGQPNWNAIDTVYQKGTGLSDSNSQIVDKIYQTKGKDVPALADYQYVGHISGLGLPDNISNFSWKTYFYPIDANGNFIDSQIMSQQYLTKYLSVTKNDALNVSSELDAQRMLDETKANTTNIARLKDGSYMVSVKLTPDFMGISKDDMTKALKASLPYALASDTDKQKMLENTLAFYQNPKLKGNSLFGRIQWTSNDTQKPVMQFKIKDLTQGTALNNRQPLADSDTGLVVQNASSDITSGNLQTLGQTIARYVDDDANGAIVKVDNVIGKKEEAYHYTISVPKNYLLSSNQEKSNQITWNKDNTIDYFFNPDEHPYADQYENNSQPNDPIIIHLTHKHEKGKENKTIHEKIKYIATNNAQVPAEVNKDVTVTRDTDKDLVTGSTTYGNWSNATFDQVTTAVKPGYISSVGTIAKQLVDGNSHDINETVVYMPQVQKATYILHDDTANKDIQVQTISGVTDGKTDLNIVIPQGYQAINALPTSYTFKASNNENTVIHLKHQTKRVDGKTDNNPELSKTITRNIYVNKPNEVAKNIIQKATITRSADLDLVTKALSNFSDWGTAKLDAVKFDDVKGYTLSKPAIEAVNVTPETKDSTETINYTPNNYKFVYNIVDSDNNDALVKTITANGSTGQIVTIDTSLPNGFKTIDTVPTSVLIEPDMSNKTFKVTHEHVQFNDSKDVNETIEYVSTDGKAQLPNTYIKHATVSRVNDKDLVTNTVTHGAWSKAHFDAISIPTVKGYTSSASTINACDLDSDKNIKVIYEPNVIKVTYKLVDQDNNNKVLNTYTTSGTVNKDMQLHVDIPENYIGDDTKSVTPTDDTTITFALKHKLQNVSDNKAVTRTIDIAYPKGKIDTIVQNATLARTGVKDLVTGKINYTDWNKQTLSSLPLADYDGYTIVATKLNGKDINAKLQNINSIDVTPDMGNINLKVAYVANPSDIDINYLDNGKIVAKQTLTGRTDETVDFVPQVPKGYKLVSNAPKVIKFHATNEPINLDLTRQTITIDTPVNKGDIKDGIKINDNVTKENLTQDFKRVINLIKPNNDVRTITQTITAKRLANIDMTTGKIISYTPFVSSDAFKAIDIPTLAGYTASQNNVAETKVDTNGDRVQTINVFYIPKDELLTVHYLDNGKELATQTFNGKYDSAKELNLNVPKGYKNDNKLIYTFTDGKQDKNINLTHATKEAFDKDTLIRTVKFVDEQGNSLIPDNIQKVERIRTNTLDETTGKMTYGDWSKADFDGFNIPVIKDYLAQYKSVPKQNADKNQTFVVKYTKLGKIIVIDDNNNKHEVQLEPDPIDASKVNQNINLPQGTHLVDENGKPITTITPGKTYHIENDKHESSDINDDKGKPSHTQESNTNTSQTDTAINNALPISSDSDITSSSNGINTSNIASDTNTNTLTNSSDLPSGNDSASNNKYANENNIAINTSDKNKNTIVASNTKTANNVHTSDATINNDLSDNLFDNDSNNVDKLTYTSNTNDGTLNNTQNSIINENINANNISTQDSTISVATTNNNDVMRDTTAMQRTNNNSNVNHKVTLPQTGEKDDLMLLAIGELASAIGILGIAKLRRKKY